MPISLRLGALLFAAVSSDQSVSLTQDAKKISKAKRDQKPLNSLLESARSLLNNGATPEAIDFAEKILEDINVTVLDAILDESAQSQHVLYEHHRLILSLYDDLHADLSDAFEHNHRCHTLHQSHQYCRGEQHDFCYGQAPYDRDDHTKFPIDITDLTGKRPCEKELYKLHVEWVEAESLLRESREDLSGHFCPPDSNGTLYTFRVEAAPMMEQYIERKEAVERAEYAYDNLRPTCISVHHRLEYKSVFCNGLQWDMERCQCQLYHRIDLLISRFWTRYNSLLNQGHAMVENFKSDEAIRHHEYVTLKNVECLLARIHELNGRPCDTEGEYEGELAHCHEYAATLPVCKFHETLVPIEYRYETLMDFFNPIHPFVEARSEYDYNNQHWTDGNTTHGGLCLIYPVPPEPPTPCRPKVTYNNGHDERHEWNLITGLSLYTDDFPCIPTLPPKPCDAEWVRHRHAAVLPDVPQPPFASTNPGCNQYPACTPCDHEGRSEDRIVVDDQYHILPVDAAD